MHAIVHRLVPSFIALSVGFGLSAVASCTAAAQTTVKDVTRTTLDIGDAICQVLVQDPNMPDKLKLACQYVDKADGLSHLLLATVPKSQATAMGFKIVQPCAPSASASPALAPSASSSR